MIIGREPSQLGQADYQSTGVNNTFGDMLRALGHWEAASFLLCFVIPEVYLQRLTLSALVH